MRSKVMSKQTAAGQPPPSLTPLTPPVTVLAGLLREVFLGLSLAQEPWFDDGPKHRAGDREEDGEPQQTGEHSQHGLLRSSEAAKGYVGAAARQSPETRSQSPVLASAIPMAVPPVNHCVLSSRIRSRVHWNHP